MWARLGIGGDTLEAHWLDLANLGGLVVVGGQRRGRTTTLAALGVSAAEAGADLVLIQPRGVTWTHPSVVLSGAGDDAAALTELFEGHQRPLVVLVDDAEAFAGDHAMLKALLAARRIDRAVLAATTADDARSAIRGFLPDLLRARAGLVLSPQVPLDGSPSGCPCPAACSSTARQAGRFTSRAAGPRLLQVPQRPPRGEWPPTATGA